MEALWVFVFYWNKGIDIHLLVEYMDRFCMSGDRNPGSFPCRVMVMWNGVVRIEQAAIAAEKALYEEKKRQVMATKQQREEVRT